MGATALGSVSAARSVSRLPDESVFRTIVVSSDIIAIARVVSTDEWEGDPFPERLSHLEVELPLYGPVASGDTLDVWWQLMQWSPEPGTVVPLYEWMPQLDKLTGVSALYLLRTGEHLSVAGSKQPLALSPGNSEVLRERLSWIREPPESDILEVVLGSPKMFRSWIGRAEIDAPVKLNAVAAYLESYLEGLRAQTDE
jgi:hypothetical protein